ncbi:MAG: PAC2 family protein [Candidatus Kariarchaeaceae archaeon]|jgi:predicted ATP-grasp superfamily ATP-dependent carboligase
MNDSSEIQGNYLRLPISVIKKIKDYQVLIGFSGFGNVGFLALTHLVETLKVDSIAFWGSSSWYHKGRLESLLTAYKHEESKSIIILLRIPIHVSTIPQKYWDDFAEEVLSWRCKKYIIVGGLREETRAPDSLEWAGYVPTPVWEEKYGNSRSLMDHLTMIGPLSSFLTLGTAFQLPVLGILAYCNFESDDPEAAVLALNEIEKICQINVINKDKLQRFNFSFIPNTAFPFPSEDSEDTDSEDDIPGYDLNELI